MRTVLNGVYGAVASFEITSKVENLGTKKKLEESAKPSRKHTRATSLAQESVLRNTLTAGLKRQDSLKSSISNRSLNNGFGT